MASGKKLLLDVGDGVCLDAALFEPSRKKPFCTIIMSSGICMTHRDYRKILEPLAETVRVLAYSYRGHGGSNGFFDNTAVAADLAELARKFSGPVFLAGHSAGSGVSAGVTEGVAGHIFFCPYLNKNYLGRIQQLGLRSIEFLRSPVGVFDYLSHITGIANFAGFQNSRPLGDLVEVGKMSLCRSVTKIPALWMIPDKDEILGTWNQPGHIEKIRNHLGSVYPNGVDRSDLLTGLNHMFNTRVGDLLHTFNCPPETKQHIIDTILEFCRKNV